MAIDWYKEFVDLKYEPAKDDLVCLFYFEPAAGISGKEAAGRIASESSTGTWTTLFTMPPRMKALQATAFDIEGNVVKIAYPIELWEEGNAVQLPERDRGQHLRDESGEEPPADRCRPAARPT